MGHGLRLIAGKMRGPDTFTQGCLFSFGEQVPRFVAPCGLQPRAPVAKCACRQVACVDDVPARGIARTAIGAEAMQSAVDCDPGWRCEAASGDGCAKAVFEMC